MGTLDQPKAQWGIFHMVVAQAALKRPIHVAQPVDGNPQWRLEPINEIVERYLFTFDERVDVPKAAQAEPLRLLLARLNEVRVTLDRLTHWDPLVSVRHDHTKFADHEYAGYRRRGALARAHSAPAWSDAQNADISKHRSRDEKEAFLASELEAMEARSQAWGQQALELREALQVVPQPVIADGSCALASLSKAMGGGASHDETEALRKLVQDEAVRLLEDTSMQRLLFMLEGKPRVAAGSDAIDKQTLATQDAEVEESRDDMNGMPVTHESFSSDDSEFVERMRGFVTMTDERFTLAESLRHYRTRRITEGELPSLVDTGRDKAAAHVNKTAAQRGHTVADAARDLGVAAGVPLQAGDAETDHTYDDGADEMSQSILGAENAVPAEKARKSERDDDAEGIAAASGTGAFGATPAVPLQGEDARTELALVNSADTPFLNNVSLQDVNSVDNVDR